MMSRTLWIAALVPAMTAGLARAQYVYDADDFAAEIGGYYAGQYGQSIDWLSGQNFKDPQAALGRPTVDTTGDDFYFAMDDPAPVNAVYSAFRHNELCTVGYDDDATGYLELKLGRRVYDNPLNPFGCDLIVFGNTKQVIGNSQPWENGDPQAVTVGDGAFAEPGAVLVSQDGVTWRRLPDPAAQSSTTPAVRGADDFAPTLGRVYDPANPDTSINTEYWTNQWWGHPTNPTYPVDPSLAPGDFAGMTVAQVAAAYNGSAGGTGLDLQDLAPADYAALATDPNTGMKWIRYVRIENPKDESGEYYGVGSEVDAVADVFPRRTGDANLDGVVDASDYMRLKGKLGSPAGVDWWEGGDFDDDGTTGTADLGAMIANFGMDNGEHNPAGQSGAASSVPAPHAAVLLLAGLPAILRRRRG